MYDGYLNRYSFVNDGRKTTLVPLSSANVFVDQLKLEERKKEFEEKKLKEKRELSEKIEKNQREKKKMKKEMKLKKKGRERVIWLQLER